MTARHSEYAGTGAMRPGQQIDAIKLNAWMLANVEGYDGR
jgi:hypothetical protein